MGRRKKVEKVAETSATKPNHTAGFHNTGCCLEKTDDTNSSFINTSRIGNVKMCESVNLNRDMFDVEKEFRKLYDKAIKMGLTGEDFAKIEVLHKIAWDGSYFKLLVKYTMALLIIIAVLCFSFILILLLEWPMTKEGLAHAWFNVYGSDINQEMCIINMPELISDIFRPPVECSFCENVTSVDVVYNISQEEFEEMYAYSGIPVLVGDGTLNWTAPNYFSFEFFKEIYKEGSPALDNQETNCQFFPYKTSFKQLGEVFAMSPERANMKDGFEPWYIGWSNCDFAVANILRKHYQKPYFLPKLSESSKTDWIFMGSPGYGAQLHIDHVGNPSWQAQITGTKRWTLEPPPECYYTCVDKIEVIVHPGQINFSVNMMGLSPLMKDYGSSHTDMFMTL